MMEEHQLEHHLNVKNIHQVYFDVQKQYIYYQNIDLSLLRILAKNLKEAFE